jgi:putative ABC transport system permease protein
MSPAKPPRLARFLFDWYCGAARVDDLRGDMEEIFEKNVQRRGIFRARMLYWRQVISLLTSYAVRTRKKNAEVPAFARAAWLPLLNNYFLVGLRNLARQKYFTIINIAGLAIGMSISLLFITLFISVTDYDEFHENKDNIARIITTRDDKTFASAPEPLAEKLKAEFAGAGDVIRIGRYLFTSEPQERQEVYVQGYFVDPAFLSAFTFPLLSGDPATALNEPQSIVLTEKSARKVFATTDVLGKVIKMGRHGDFIVKGVVRDYPANSHLTFDALASYSTLDARASAEKEKGWQQFMDHYVYLKLPVKTDIGALQQFLDRAAAQAEQIDPGHHTSFEIQKLTDITPGPELEDQVGPQWSYLSFAIAGALALLILLPACFNYTNISIARALKRSKEIGLRKTLGGMRLQIFLQFLMETVLVTLLSLIGGVLIFIVIRGEFRSMMVHAAALDLSLTFERLMWFVAFAILTGLVAGAIPAIHFSRLNPMEAIRNAASNKTMSGARIRKGLTVFQFALCLSFILALIIFGKQYKYAMNFDLGFDRENILDVQLQQVDPNVFATAFQQLSPVQEVSMSSGVMGHGVPGTWTHMEGKSDSTETYFMHIDGAFIANMNVELLAGRTFTKDEPVDRTAIVNESFLRRFGFNGPAEAIGERVVVDHIPVEIVGVIRDFHFWQLHAPVAPFFFRYNPDKLRVANLKITSSEIQATLLELERTWRKISEGRPFVANFLDDETAGAFSNYIVLLKIFGFLGLLAISISCLGLLGMVVFNAESRIKEVGIRKVMGASVWGITYLLSRGYLKLMLIAAVFAIPVAFLLDKFLSGLNYYRVSITVFDILLGVAIMFVLGVGTMASQTVRAANTNPAETLKYE